MGSSFDTKNVKNMSSMLKDCENVEYLNLSTKGHDTPSKIYFNTEKVKNMSKMLDGCKNLREIIVSSFGSDLINLICDKFDTFNDSDMSDMFSGCESIENLDLTFRICLKIEKI